MGFVRGEHYLINCAWRRGGATVRTAMNEDRRLQRHRAEMNRIYE